MSFSNSIPLTPSGQEIPGRQNRQISIDQIKSRNNIYSFDCRSIWVSESVFQLLKRERVRRQHFSAPARPAD